MLNNVVFWFIFLIVVTEASSELLVKSGFFAPLRNFVFSRKDSKLFGFLTLLLACPYCASVWVAILFSTPVFLFVLYNNNFDMSCMYIYYIPIVLVFHRCSNYLHDISDRYFTLQ